MEINFTCHTAPLQAEGQIEDSAFGLCWYFRARHNHWSFSVGVDKDKAIDGQIFSIGAEYKPKVESAASYMSKTEGIKVIKYGLDCYEKWRKMKC